MNIYGFNIERLMLCYYFFWFSMIINEPSYSIEPDRDVCVPRRLLRQLKESSEVVPPPWTAGALLERSGELLELLGGVASLAELLPRAAASCLEDQEREVKGHVHAVRSQPV